MNATEFHLNPRTWELRAKQEEQSDTPLPHPEQLLNLRNRIIPAKVAALFYSQEHSKQTKKEKRRRERQGADRQQNTVRQFDADSGNCLDRSSDEFLRQRDDSNKPSPSA